MEKNRGFDEGPLPDTNFLYSLLSLELKLKQLRLLPVKLQSHVSVLLMRSVWGPFRGWYWSSGERKPDWISYLNGTQIHHSDGRSIGFTHLAWVRGSLKQTFVSLWLVWMSRFNQFCGNFPLFLSIIVF